MPEIRAHIPHQLDAPKVVERLEGMLSQLEQHLPIHFRELRYHTDGNQIEFSYRTYGFELGWKAVVRAQTIELLGEIPISARPFEHKIEQSILSQIDAALEPPVEVRRAA